MHFFSLNNAGERMFFLGLIYLRDLHFNTLLKNEYAPNEGNV